MLPPQKWLLLLYGLPTKNSAARVSLWRQLKKTGALPFKTSASLLPDKPELQERFQWLAQQVRDAGGEATLIRIDEIEGQSPAELMRQFNEARAADYEAVLRALTKLVARKKPRAAGAQAAELDKLTRQFEEIRRLDFFDCPRAQDVQMLLRRTGKQAGEAEKGGRLSPKKFVGRTWLTRPRPHIDRVASAWLIRRFIDPKATFIFGTEPARHPNAIPYDMFEVEFSHHGEDCTFETLVHRFGITDRAVQKVATMVHDADLEDGKFQMVECVGIDRILHGWAKTGMSDEELVSRGGECIEALYQSLL